MGKLKLALAIFLIITISLAALAQDFKKMIREMNVKLAGSGMAVLKAEVMLKDSADQVGNLTVYVADRYQLLGSQWAPGDPRRDANGNNITYLIDPTYMISSSGLNLEPINDTTFMTWKDEVGSGKLHIVKRPYPTQNPNFVLWYYYGIGGNPDPFQADIVTTGFLNIFPAGSGILGVTWTFIWVDGSGNPTDINRDGYADTALKEIWYNDDYNWVEGGPPGIDFETVCLHENGHGLGLAHFGMIFTNPSGKLFASPRAVMNAIYLGILHDPLRTDHSAINHIYNNWPH